MTLSDIATVGNIVSSVALTVSLVYVALQVRQAEKNQRGLMQQGRANRITGDLMQLAAPEMASQLRDGTVIPVIPVVPLVVESNCVRAIGAI